MPDDPSSINPRTKSLSQLPTGEIKLSKSFLSELELVAPKKKWSKAWLLLPIALVGAGAWLAFTTKGREIVARVRHTPTPSAITAAPPISVDVPVASETASVTASATASETPSASAAVSVVASASAAPSASASSKPWTRRRKPH